MPHILSKCLLLALVATRYGAALPADGNPAPSNTDAGPPYANSTSADVPVPSNGTSTQIPIPANGTTPISGGSPAGPFQSVKPCHAEPMGYAPMPDVDTAQAFLASTNFSDSAKKAQVPMAYALAFQNQHAATQQNGYLGFSLLSNYDPAACARECEKLKQCEAFNLYIAREPSVRPAARCPDPASTGRYICSYYDTPVSQKTATNRGQYRQNFEVVIAGSNGYNKKPVPPAIPLFTGPVRMAGAVNAPLFNGTDTYLGFRTFGGDSIHNTTLCATSCQEITEYDRNTAGKDKVYKPCNFFNVYMLSHNGAAPHMICAYYMRGYDETYATNMGQVDGKGNSSVVSDSFGYTLKTLDSGVVN